MSDEWKNERAEAEMRKGTEAIRIAAEKKALLEIDMKWDEVKVSLYSGNEDRKNEIDWVIELLQLKYELPKKKAE
jgi:hypothetical protein